MRLGTFLVVEGTDGSGKTTQVARLVERLEREGYDVVTFDFPQYDQASSYFIKEYQSGAYGSAEKVGPYTGSVFYALDRYQAAPAIREAIAAGKIVIANRFTGSNMAHQGTRFEQSEHRRGYFIWLDNLEYEMLKIPRPDRSIVLRVPAETAQTMTDQTTDLAYMQRTIDVYDDLCQLFPRDFVRIDCVRDQKLLDVETIHTLLWQSIEPLLPPKPKKRTSTNTKLTSVSGNDQSVINEEKKDDLAYYIPEKLDPKTKASYTKIMDRIIALYSEMVAETSEQAPVYEVMRHVLPVATQSTITIAGTKQTLENLIIQPRGTSETKPQLNLEALASQYLSENHASETGPVILTSVWPRNELDLVPDMLYEYSSLPLRDIEDRVAGWPISRRIDAFEAYLHERSGNNNHLNSTLEKAHYSWDVVSDFSTFYHLQKHLAAKGLGWQPLTPRYGYDVPQLIDEAGLTDRFEKCFDLSLELYSMLQANGYAEEAQYATLLGHKMRWKATYNGLEALQLHELCMGPLGGQGSRTLAQQMHERLAEVHPMIAEAIK